MKKHNSKRTVWVALVLSLILACGAQMASAMTVKEGGARFANGAAKAAKVVYKYSVSGAKYLVNGAKAGVNAIKNKIDRVTGKEAIREEKAKKEGMLIKQKAEAEANAIKKENEKAAASFKKELVNLREVKIREIEDYENIRSGKIQALARENKIIKEADQAKAQEKKKLVSKINSEIEESKAIKKIEEKAKKEEKIEKERTIKEEKALEEADVNAIKNANENALKYASLYVNPKKVGDSRVNKIRRDIIKKETDRATEEAEANAIKNQAITENKQTFYQRILDKIPSISYFTGKATNSTSEKNHAVRFNENVKVSEFDDEKSSKEINKQVNSMPIDGTKNRPVKHKSTWIKE